MYPYNYNMAVPNRNMYRNVPYGRRGNEDRFFAGGFIAPLLLGGIAGYALGRPNYTYPPYQYAPYPNTYYNNFYYYPYYY